MPDTNEIYMDNNYKLHYPDGATHLDGIPEDLMEIFDPHWGKFPPQHPMIGHIAGLAYIILWLISFFGNGLVIFIFLKVKTLRTPTNMFVVNLAFSDLCMMTTQGLPVAINMFISRYWAFGVLACRVYACLGAIFGTLSIMTMVVIGYDRYNVIVKGFSGVKITPGKAFLLLVTLWLYCAACSVPPFFGWGGYSAEGLLLTCSYDYLKQDWNHKSFMLYAFIFNYIFPLILIGAFYFQITKAVVMHEAALKAQAKKMNVESLRSGDQSGESAEVKIAKVAITNVLLWFCIWTPYALITMIGCFGNSMLVTPLVSQLPAFLAKTASAINPVIYAISHPKFREALATEVPCLGIGDLPKQLGGGDADVAKSTATKA